MENYLYRKGSYLKSLIELLDYCKEKRLEVLIEKEDMDYNINIQLGKDSVINVNTSIEDFYGLKLVILNVRPSITHRKFVKNKFKHIKNIGGVGGAGIGGVMAAGAMAVPGGIGIGIALFGLSATLGAAPGFVLDIAEKGVSTKLLKKCEVHMNKITALFDKNLNIPSQKKVDDFANQKETIEWVENFIIKNGLKLYTCKVKKGFLPNSKVIDLEFNSYIETKNKITIFDTFDPTGIGRKIDGKIVKESIKIKEETSDKYMSALVKSVILPKLEKDNAFEDFDEDTIMKLEKEFETKYIHL